MLKLKYTKKGDIPAGFESLYTDKDGVWILTGVDGLKTQEDLQAVNDLLTQERGITKGLKETVSALGDVDATKVGDLMGLIGELGDDFDAQKYRDTVTEVTDLRKQISGGGDADGVIRQLREENSELKRVSGQTQRELSTVKRKSEEFQGVSEGLQKRIDSSTIREAVIAAATELKVEPSAFEDAVLLGQSVFELDANSKVVAREGLDGGVITGTTPTDWLREIQPKRQHWWPNSTGAGGSGSGSGNGFSGKNPWKKDTLNLTEQGQLVLSSPDLAKSLAKEAGVTLDI